MINELLTHDPETGKLSWKYVVGGRPQRNAKYAGKDAFTSIDTNGYVQGRVGGKKYYAHRVIWALHYGRWPEGQIDHINGNRADNRIANLRLASPSQNGANRHRVRGSSLCLGVSKHKQSGRWIAYIQKNKKRTYIGIFKTEKEAAAAYASAARRIHGEFAAV